MLRFCEPNANESHLASTVALAVGIGFLTLGFVPDDQHCLTGAHKLGRANASEVVFQMRHLPFAGDGLWIIGLHEVSQKIS